MLLLLPLLPSLSGAEAAPLWGIDHGTVTAIASSRNAVYIGGAFESVGPSTGGGVPVDPRRGMPKPTYPAVTGYAWVSIPDGSGGWYIGGNFRSVGGKPHANLAHILGDGSVDDWNADTNDFVFALILRDRMLYVGGAFTTIGGQSRHAVARFNASSGALEPWQPDPNGIVRAMLLHGRRLYFGGDFTVFDGQPRNHLAAVDIGDAHRRDNGPESAQPTRIDRRRRPPAPTLTAWNPSVDYEEDPPAYVWALASDEKDIFVGGTFSHVSGQPRNCVASIDQDSGAVLPWAPQVQLEFNPYFYVPRMQAMAIHKHRLYAGGRFSSVNGEGRNALAALDAKSGAVEAWNPALVDVLPYAEVDVLGVDDVRVYVGGSFRTVRGTTRENAASFDAASGALTEWRPRPNSSVSALGFGEDAVYMGGPFTSTWDWEYRIGLAALDRKTGKVLPWNPGITGFIVSALAVSESTVYVGGGFGAIGGKPRRGLAAVDAVSGAVTDWNPGCDGDVESLLLNGSTLYVGGSFSQIGGQARSNLAAVDATLGSVRDWKPETNDIVSALLLSGDRIFLGGWFNRVGGQVRYMLAAVDATTGALTPWNPAANDIVDALTVVGDKIYVGGSFRTLGGLSRAGLGAIDLSTGLVADWNPSPGGSFSTSVYALASSGSSVFVGGDFRSIGGESRGFLAAVDATSGSLIPSIPEADNPVWSLATGGGDLFAGGSFNAVGGEPHAGIVALPIRIMETRIVGAVQQSAAGILLSSVAPIPVRGAATLQYTLSTRVPVTLAVYDLQGRAVSTLVDHEMQQAGSHEVQVRTESWRAGCYLYRLEAGGVTATRKMLVVRLSCRRRRRRGSWSDFDRPLDQPAFASWDRLGSSS